MTTEKTLSALQRAISERRAGFQPALSVRLQQVPAPRVLVIDDEVSVRQGCVLTLKLDGFLAEGEESSRVAYEMLNCMPGRYDVLVLDYAMPELDGIAFAAALDPWSRPPIILTSAYADGRVALAALRAGIWDFLAKPLVPDELRRGVRQAYSRVVEAKAPEAWLTRALLHCNHCAWAEALAELKSAPSKEPGSKAGLVAGLIYQIMGDMERAKEAFERSHWWHNWHHQGAEIWVELARRLAA